MKKFYYAIEVYANGRAYSIRKVTADNHIYLIERVAYQSEAEARSAAAEMGIEIAKVGSSWEILPDGPEDFRDEAQEEANKEELRGIIARWEHISTESVSAARKLGLSGRDELDVGNSAWELRCFFNRLLESAKACEEFYYDDFFGGYIVCQVQDFQAETGISFNDYYKGSYSDLQFCGMNMDGIRAFDCWMMEQEPYASIWALLSGENKPELVEAVEAVELVEAVEAVEESDTIMEKEQATEADGENSVEPSSYWELDDGETVYYAPGLTLEEIALVIANGYESGAQITLTRPAAFAPLTGTCQGVSVNLPPVEPGIVQRAFEVFKRTAGTLAALL